MRAHLSLVLRFVPAVRFVLAFHFVSVSASQSMPVRCSASSGVSLYFIQRVVYFFFRAPCTFSLEVRFLCSVYLVVNADGGTGVLYAYMTRWMILRAV